MKEIETFEDLPEEDQKKIREALGSFNQNQICKILESLYKGYVFRWSQTEAARTERFQGQNPDNY